MSASLSLSDQLRAKGVQRVLYFHADHFEPWSLGVNPVAVRAVDRFRELTASSAYGRRLSLFYSTHNPHRLDVAGGLGAFGRRAPGDAVVFEAYSDRSKSVNAEVERVIRPLIADHAHEMHLHVHHEWWTCNSHNLGSEVSRWVNQQNDPEADEARLDVFIKTATESIAAEIGAPFERWGFVHGNWALCASDDKICRIQNELDILVRNGAWGDFTFPAGRAHCDPALRWPFTCKPVAGVRAFDLPEAAPTPIREIPVDIGPDSFFIWNSPTTAGWVSLDWYSPENRERFAEPDRVISEWINGSVILDGTMFVKTHAHSLKWEYNIGGGENPIPHTHPQVVALFDRFMRVCETARVEFVPGTVNGVAAEILRWRAPDTKTGVSSPATDRSERLEANTEGVLTREDTERKPAGLPNYDTSTRTGSGMTANAILPRALPPEFKGRGEFELSTYGDVCKLECPLCRSGSIGNIWRIPMTNIEPPIELFGGYFNQVPTLSVPFKLFCFDFCYECESIFLNPDIDRAQHLETYRESTHYQEAFQNRETWRGYEERYRDMLAYVPPNSAVLIDAACGMGQILHIARNDGERRWQRMIGLELSEAYVRSIVESGLEAYRFDLDRDDGRQLLGEQMADFVCFSEAFEHVAAPLAALSRLLELLRPGGRLYFSAQRYGRDVWLAIRPGEPIYISRYLVDRLPELLNCLLVDVREAGGRFFVVLERTAEPVRRYTADIAVRRAGEFDSQTVVRRAGELASQTVVRRAGELASQNAAGRADEPEPEIAVRRAGELESQCAEAPQIVTITLRPPFTREIGHCCFVRLKGVPHHERLAAIADTDDAPNRSPVELLEDERPLGPAHVLHSAIREMGGGRFSHWFSDLYFSTSDNSDPNVNGRSYALRFPA